MVVLATIRVGRRAGGGNGNRPFGEMSDEARQPRGIDAYYRGQTQCS